jgi:hypothetical protein
VTNSLDEGISNGQSPEPKIYRAISDFFSAQFKPA